MASFYHSTLQQHQTTPTGHIVGIISLIYSDHHLDQKQQQTKTWADTVEIVKQFFSETSNKIDDLGNWGILYEYKIPRRAKRIDVVLLSTMVRKEIGSAD